MGRDKNERRHRRTITHAGCVSMMDGANFDAVPPMAAAMGLLTEADMDAAYEGLTDAEVADLRRRGFSGKFPELTDAENNVIFRARVLGFGVCYHAFPDAETQAKRTLAGAQRWLVLHK